MIFAKTPVGYVQGGRAEATDDHWGESRAVIAKLSMLFVLDAFAGGFVMQTIIVYWSVSRAHSLKKLAHPAHRHTSADHHRLSPLSCRISPSL